MSSLTSGQIRELRLLFDAFDGDADGLLQADEVGAMLQCCGITMSEPEVRRAAGRLRRTRHAVPHRIPHPAHAVPQVLDMITEVQPNLRQLPFDEFINIMLRELPGSDSVDAEVAETFTTFAGPDDAITSASLQQAMGNLGKPVSKLMADEMVREADLDGDGVVNMSDYCAMNNVAKP